MKERVLISSMVFFLGEGVGGIDNYNYREEMFKSQF